VSDDHTQARLQRIEDDVRELKETVSVLGVVNDREAKARIQAMFGSDPRMVIVYRGVQRGLTQEQIAAALRERGLKYATQPRVSESLTQLEDEQFIKRTPKGPPLVLLGWEKFGLKRVLKNTLRTHGVPDLP
jgi:hypothetical protein